MSAPAGDPGDMARDWRQSLRAFYSLYNADKVAEVDDILAKYRGKVRVHGPRQPP